MRGSRLQMRWKIRKDYETKKHPLLPDFHLYSQNEAGY